MKFRHLLAIGILGASLLAADGPEKITADKVCGSYKTFTRITKEPKSVGAEFAGRCISTPTIDRMRTETGPHAMHYLHYYLNDAARHHRDARGDGAFPPGSVIVKENLYSGSVAKSADFTEVSAVTGMIKRESGWSPKTSDWEFFYFYPRSAPKAGTDIVWDKAKPEDLKSCVSCHSNAADMVFGRFDKPYVMPKAADGGKALKLEVAPKEGAPLNPKK